MNKLKLFLSLFLAVVSFGGINIVNAVSANVTNDDTNNSFTITRTITGAKATVQNTFEYSITADSNNPEGVNGAPTSASVTFDVAPISGTATATGVIDLKGMTFTKNGDYKYILRETSSTKNTIYPVDSTNVYTIQISVRNKGTNDFSAKVVTINAKDKNGNKTTDLVFTSEGVFTYISIGKTVEGNMADVDKYFKVKVNILGVVGDTYTIGGQTYNGSGMQTTYTVGQDNYIFLKHGEEITIGKNGSDNELPTGLKYSFEEQEAIEYDTYINDSDAKSKSSGELTIASNNSNTIINSYETSTITGVMTKASPYIVVVFAAIIIGTYMVIRNKRKILEEE